MSKRDREAAENNSQIPMKGIVVAKGTGTITADVDGQY